jgi:dihydrofolate reductase
VPADLKRFKSLTIGHPVIMGRKTFESVIEILGKPLPKRTNIVITRNRDYKHDGVTVVGSLEEGIRKGTRRKSFRDSYWRRG